MKKLKLNFLNQKVKGLIARGIEYSHGTYNQADPTAYTKSSITWRNLYINIIDCTWGYEIDIMEIGKKGRVLASLYFDGEAITPRNNWNHRWWKVIDNLIASVPEIDRAREYNEEPDHCPSWCI